MQEVLVVNMAKRTIPHFWSEEETSHLVNVVKDMNIMSFVDGRKYRDSDICKKVSEKLSCCCRCYWLQEEESEMTRIAS